MMRRIERACCALVAGWSCIGSAMAADASPVLRWTSEHEKGVYGYIVYRSLAEKGPFLRVNARLVPRADASDAEGTKRSGYRFTDETAKPGVTYYYYIDAVADTGRKQRLTGVVRKAPSAAAPGR